MAVTSELKASRKLIKFLHGKDWTSHLDPTLGENGGLDLHIFRYSTKIIKDLANLQPIERLHMFFEAESELSEIRECLRVLLTKSADSLRFLSLDHTLDVTSSPSSGVRNVIDHSKPLPWALSRLNTIIALDINLGDPDVHMLSQHCKLTHATFSNCDISIASVKNLARIETLRTLDIEHCPNFPPTASEELKSEVPGLKRLRVR